MPRSPIPRTVFASLDLFFNVGSAANFEETLDTFSAGGLMAGVSGASTMTADAIWMVRVSDTGRVPTLSNLIKIGTGSHNAAGMAFDPQTGDLYISKTTGSTGWRPPQNPTAPKS